MTNNDRYSHIHKIRLDDIELVKAGQIMASRKKIWEDVALSALKRAARYLTEKNQKDAEREVSSAMVLMPKTNINYKLASIMYPDAFSKCTRKNSLVECHEIGEMHKKIGLRATPYPEWTATQIDAYMKAVHS